MPNGSWRAKLKRLATDMESGAQARLALDRRMPLRGGPCPSAIPQPAPIPISLCKRSNPSGAVNVQKCLVRAVLRPRRRHRDDGDCYSIQRGAKEA
jgi:hypothetical protein